MLTRGLPRSVGELLARFRGCFTTPTFQTFTALVVGLWAQRGLHTVTGMLTATGLAGVWHHMLAAHYQPGQLAALTMAETPGGAGSVGRRRSLNRETPAGQSKS